MLTTGLHPAAIADRREVFVDAEHHQDEFGSDAGEQDADQHSGEACQRRDRARDRIERHGAERRHQSGETAEDHDHDDQPVEQLDDRRRDEPLPLEQVADVEHDLLPMSRGTGLARDCTRD